MSSDSTISSTSSTSISPSPTTSSQTPETVTDSTISSTSSTSISPSPTTSSQTPETITGSTSSSTASQVWTGPNGLVSGMLHLVLTPMSWLNARVYCRNNFTDMAAVLSQQDQKNVATLLSPYTPSTGFWMGLRFNRFKSNWYWSGTQLWGGFSYWGSREPNTPFTNACGMISGAPAQNFTWSSKCCGQELPFICYEGSS
ncbi:L-selectin-like [Lithobates pipiens]